MVKYKVLSCQWVSKYKIDKYSNFQKYKTWLVIYGNEQQKLNLLTKVITFAVTSLQVLLAIIIKFDLQILQFEIVNAFLHINLNKTIFIKISVGYAK